MASIHAKNAETTSSSTSTKVDFDNLFFESELFKIILTEPNDSMPILDSPPTTTGTANNSGTVFYVHKRLLASLSLEMAKHTDNRMKEGLSGEMALGGVDTSTMQWFLQWAYRGECKLWVFFLAYVGRWVRVNYLSMFLYGHMLKKSPDPVAIQNFRL